MLRGADVYLGLSRPGAVSAAGIDGDERRRDRLRDGEPDARDRARRSPARTVSVVATGRSDYPNQINNVLAFPGVFRGALDVRASRITEGMKVAAAHALAAVIHSDELGPEYVVPSVFNRDVAPTVAAAVAEAAHAGRRRPAAARSRPARLTTGADAVYS